MSKDRVGIIFHVQKPWRNRFNALVIKGSRSDFIREAIEEKIEREYGEKLPGEMRPHGVRKDSRPSGWRGTLYKDRYQLVAVWDENRREWQIDHLHQPDTQLPERGTLRAETPYPLEMTVYAPEAWSLSTMRHDLHMELYEDATFDRIFDRET